MASSGNGKNGSRASEFYGWALWNGPAEYGHSWRGPAGQSGVHVVQPASCEYDLLLVSHSKELREVDIELFCLVERERLRVCDEFLVGQNGQIVLLAVASSTTEPALRGTM